MKLKTEHILFIALVITANLFGCVSTPKITKIEKNKYLVEKKGSGENLHNDTLKVAINLCNNRGEELKVISINKTKTSPDTQEVRKSSIVFSCLDELSKDKKLNKINFSNIDKLKSILFSSQNLSPIEGIWTWIDSSYTVAIVKNEYDSFSDYEYIGITTRTSDKFAEEGELKLLLNSTASDNVYTGVYVTNKRVREGVTFILKQGKYMEVSVPSGSFNKTKKVSIIKSYPNKSVEKHKSNSNAKASKNKTPPAFISQGSCFFISDTGNIVTNYHVIKGSEHIKILDHFGNEFNAKIKHLDPSNDLAILKVETKKHKYLTLSPLGTARTGLEVFSVGYPVKSILGDNVKYTQGVISSTTGIRNMANMFQMTVPIQPGNSGGPIINMAGEVVGVATSTATVSEFLKQTGTLPQNVNWAIKSDYILLLVENTTATKIPTRQKVIDAAINASCMVRATL